MLISDVDTLNKKVNKVINSAADHTIIKGLYQRCVPSVEPRITGNTGKIQGASMLNTQAVNERMKSDVIDDNEILKDSDYLNSGR